jgi:hypothetical protein
MAHQGIGCNLIGRNTAYGSPGQWMQCGRAHPPTLEHAGQWYVVTRLRWTTESNRCRQHWNVWQRGAGARHMLMRRRRDNSYIHVPYDQSWRHEGGGDGRVDVKPKQAGLE